MKKIFLSQKKNTLKLDVPCVLVDEVKGSMSENRGWCGLEKVGRKVEGGREMVVRGL